MNQALAPAVILGGSATGLAVLRALGRNGIPLYVAGPGPRLLRRSRWYRMIPGEEAESQDLTDRLSSLPHTEMVLFPCSDEWALLVAHASAASAGRLLPTVPEPEVLERLVDKQKFALLLAEHDVPRPRTISISSPSDLERLDEESLADFFLKPVSSQRFSQRLGTKGVMIRTREDARTVLRHARAEGLEMVLQEYIPGPATAYRHLDGFVDRQGRLCALYARRRVRMHPSWFGNSTLVETVPLNEVEDAVQSVRKLVEATGFFGFFDAEFKLDTRDGRFKIIEFNGRFCWQTGLAVACGLDVCTMAYRDALGLPVDVVTEYPVGRRWVHPIPDLAAWWGARASERAGMPRPLPPVAWLKAVHAVYSRDDPLPLIDELADAARRSVARLSKRGRPRRLRSMSKHPS